MKNEWYLSRFEENVAELSQCVAEMRPIALGARAAELKEDWDDAERLDRVYLNKYYRMINLVKELAHQVEG